MNNIHLNKKQDENDVQRRHGLYFRWCYDHVCLFEDGHTLKHEQTKNYKNRILNKFTKKKYNLRMVYVVGIVQMSVAVKIIWLLLQMIIFILGKVRWSRGCQPVHLLSWYKVVVIFYTLNIDINNESINRTCEIKYNKKLHSEIS